MVGVVDVVDASDVLVEVVVSALSGTTPVTSMVLVGCADAAGVTVTCTVAGAGAAASSPPSTSTIEYVIGRALALSARQEKARKV